MSTERDMYDYCPSCRCAHCMTAKKYHAERAALSAELDEQIRKDRIGELQRELDRLRIPR